MVPLMLSALEVPVIFLASATPLANNIIAKTDETNTRMGLLITIASLSVVGRKKVGSLSPRLCFCTPQSLQQSDASRSHSTGGSPLGAFANFLERPSVLKNSLDTRFRSGSGTKHADFGAFRTQFVVATSPMPTFSTRWPLLGCEYPGEWLWATPRSSLTLLLGEPKVPCK